MVRDARTHVTHKVAAMLAAVMLTLVAVMPQVALAQKIKAPVQLVFWTWTPSSKIVALYNRTHPGVHVVWRNIDYPSYYTKLTTALKAGSGAPDVAIIEYMYLPQYENLGSLENLSQYGAQAVKSQYEPWAWAAVSQGSRVYGIPEDAGPMVLFYRADLFKKYGVPVPTTWTAYAAAAAKLHKANPNLFIDYFNAGSGGAYNLTPLIWQAGGHLFLRHGNTWTVTIDTPTVLKVLQNWGTLYRRGLLKNIAGTDPAPLNRAWAQSQLAASVNAAWCNACFPAAAPHQAGKWRVAPLPQWHAGTYVSANLGGSSIAVTTQSKAPRAATQFAIWLNTQDQPFKIMYQVAGLIPTSKPLLHAGWLNQPNPFFGKQNINAVFGKAEAAVPLGWTWGPEMTYTYAQLDQALAAVYAGRMSYADALAQVQNKVVNFMRAQGYTVQ